MARVPTTTITVASFQTALAETADAVEARDWATASRKLAKAEIINAGLEVAVEGKGEKVARRDSLEKTRAQLEAAIGTENRINGGSRFIRTRVNP